MSTVQDEITKVQELLHDSGTIWTSAELLRAFNDGYRRLLQGSDSVKDHVAFDIPPRHSMTFCYEWEDTYGSGPQWMCMLGARVGRWRCTTRWEAQQAEHVGELLTDAVTTTAEMTGITQQWERFIVGTDVDRNYDLIFPRNINSPSRVRFNNSIMLPISTLELDQVHLNWPSFVGQPYWWTAGTGRVQSIEIYRIQTDYTQAYQLTYAQYYDSVGMPRYWSGSRTYTQDLTGVSAFNTMGYTNPSDAQALLTVRPLAESSPGMAARITLYETTPVVPTDDLSALSAKLNGSHTISQTSITIISDPGWDPAGEANGFAVRVESEIMYYYAAAPFHTFINVVRGAEGTTPAAHNGSKRAEYIHATPPKNFCIQPWEYDTVTSASILRTGGTIGTYRWESQLTVIVGSNTIEGADALPLAIGMPRAVSSPDRQYVPVMRGSGVYTVTGIPREWGSSDGNFFVTYNAINQSDLTLTESPDLLPAQVSKYLRYYVLWQAFGRQGEGYRQDLADHWYARFERGARFMRKLSDVAYTDHIYVREEVGATEVRRVPLVSLPPQFERIW